MLFRRGRGDVASRLSELEPAHEALAEGRYDVAFALLESAARRPWGRPTQAIYWLHLAAVYALYGLEGLDNGTFALRNAVSADAKAVQRPLYQALYWEFAAYRGEAAVDVKRGVREIDGEGDPVANYHAASALCSAGALKTASRRLSELDDAALPRYLAWRRWSLLGQTQERLGRHEEAALAFEAAAAGSSGSERAAEQLSLASCRLELDDPAAALELLSSVDEQLLVQSERAFKRYLEGRSELELGNPNRAIELFREAEALESDEQHTFNLRYAHGQSLVAVGRFAEAAEVLVDAVESAPSEHRPFAQHEYAYALIESDRLDEAEHQLEEVLADPSYPHHAEAFADLADVLVKRGDYDRGRSVAEQALDMGVTAPACLTLGGIAFEYFRFDEAIGWFEQAVSASQPGTPNWINAQQLLADIYAQRGPEAAEQLLIHARAALEHTPEHNDWFLPLTGYVERAQGWLGGHDRLLN
jgi:hypothetical protein